MIIFNTELNIEIISINFLSCYIYVRSAQYAVMQKHFANLLISMRLENTQIYILIFINDK